MLDTLDKGRVKCSVGPVECSGLVLRRHGLQKVTDPRKVGRPAGERPLNSRSYRPENGWLGSRERPTAIVYPLQEPRLGVWMECD